VVDTRLGGFLEATEGIEGRGRDTRLVFKAGEAAGLIVTGGDDSTCKGSAVNDVGVSRVVGLE
jgi:hypothetical protein